MTIEELKKHGLDILKAALAAGLMAVLTSIINSLGQLHVAPVGEIAAQISAGVVAIKKITFV